MLPTDYRQSVERDHQPLMFKAVLLGLCLLFILWLRFRPSSDSAFVERVEFLRDGSRIISAKGMQFKVGIGSPLFKLEIRTGDKVTIKEFEGPMLDKSDYVLDVDAEVHLTSVVALDTTTSMRTGWISVDDTLRKFTCGGKPLPKALRVGDTIRVLKLENAEDGDRYVADL